MKELYNGELVDLATPTKLKDGKRYKLTEEEIAAKKAKQGTWEAESFKRNARVAIHDLEALITPRRLREAVLGVDNGWLANQESLIEIERNKLGD